MTATATQLTILFLGATVSQTCTPLPLSSPHGVAMRLVLSRRSLDAGAVPPCDLFGCTFTLWLPAAARRAPRRPPLHVRRLSTTSGNGIVATCFSPTFGHGSSQGAIDDRSLWTMRGSGFGHRLDGRPLGGSLVAVSSSPATALVPDSKGLEDIVFCPREISKCQRLL